MGGVFVGAQLELSGPAVILMLNDTESGFNDLPFVLVAAFKIHGHSFG